MQEFSEKQYKPVRTCIYCGSTENLTREHIIPYALGGTLVLPKASCKDCADITKEIEGQVLRGFMLQARAAADFPTRHPENRPRKFDIKIAKDGSQEGGQLAVEDNLNLLHMPLFKSPGFWEGVTDVEGIEIYGTETVYFGRPPEEIVAELGAQTLTVEQELQYHAFARMIGKIAFAFSVAELGLETIKEAYVLPSVLGRKSDIGRWVGSVDHVFEVEKQGAAHALQCYKVPWLQGAKSETLVVTRIKLLANTDPRRVGRRLTAYEVIVGRC